MEGGLGAGSGGVEPGTLIGKCRVAGLLGRGGMGSVYRAHHCSLDIDVALKIVSLRRDDDDTFKLRDRFLLEARTAARLRHENVVAVLDVDEHADMLYMIMELVDGGSARQLLRGGPLPIPHAARIIRDAASGLAAAHRRGIVHRDIKPANILVTREGVVKVSDFGLAAWRAGDSHLTAPGQVLGTPDYMAPEQVRAEPVDARADIYALGVSFYQLLTATTPFRGGNAFETCMKHLQDPVPLLRAARSDATAELESLLSGMMAKELADRVQTADEVVRRLDPLASRTPYVLKAYLPGNAPSNAPTALWPSSTPIDSDAKTVTPTELAEARAAAGLSAGVGATPATDVAARRPLPPAQPTMDVPPPARAPASRTPRWVYEAGVIVVVAGALLGGWALARRGGSAADRDRPSPSAPTQVASTPSPAIALAVAPPDAETMRRRAEVNAEFAMRLSRIISDGIRAEADGEHEEALRLFRSVREFAGETKSVTVEGSAVVAHEQTIQLLDNLGRYADALREAQALEREHQGSVTLARMSADTERQARLRRLEQLAAAERREVVPDLLEVGPVVFALSVVDLNADGRDDVVLVGGDSVLLSQRGKLVRVTRFHDWQIAGNGKLLGVVDLDRSGLPELLLVPKARRNGPDIVIAELRPRQPPILRSMFLEAARHPSQRFRPEQAVAVQLEPSKPPALVLYARGTTRMIVRYGGPTFPAEQEVNVPLGGSLERFVVARGAGLGGADVLVLGVDAHRPAEEARVRLSVYSGGRTGHKLRTIASSSASWPWITAGDWSGDGKADLISNLPGKRRIRDSRKLVPYLGDGRGGFRALVDGPRLEVRPAIPKPWLADLNGDGRADALMVREWMNGVQLLAMISKGDGSFRNVAQTLVRGVYPIVDVATGDMDGDGHLDAALLNCSVGQLGILYGDGKGGFSRLPH